jgi:hypothetical protein
MWRVKWELSEGKTVWFKLESVWCTYLSNDGRKDDDECINKKRYKKNEKVSTVFKIPLCFYRVQKENRFKTYEWLVV